MPFTLNLEEMEGRWIAHVAELPGAFFSAATQAEAVAGAPRAIVEYLAWSEAPGGAPLEPEAQVSEIIRAWDYAPDYEVNAFFATDRPPLTAADAEAARRLLYYARAELLDSFLGLTDAELERELPGERWSIHDILRHVSSGENWYLEQIGLAHEPAWEMGDSLGRLFLVRQHLLDLLPQLVDDERVVAANGELWSPRKIVRRALWHERNHAAHIRGLRAHLVQERPHA